MQTIGVFFGSRSPEHDISIITGVFIIAELKKLGYKVAPVYISKTGEWYISEAVGSLKFFTVENYEQELARNNFNKFYLDLENSHGKLIFKKKGIGGKEVVVDVAFPAFHGSFGEDGTIQGLFEMLNVPYVGCDVAASAIAMDKVFTKLMYRAANIPTTKFVYFSRQEWGENKDRILKQIASDLTYPLFVKPARLGSSIGIAKVKNEQGLEFKIEVALHYDSKVLVEEGVEPMMDITCAILGNSPQLTASLLQESVFASDLFDFEGKYLDDGGAQLGAAQKNIIIPARLDEKTTKEIQNVAIRIYNLIGCSGTARVDFLYNKNTKEYFANEINPLPGTLYHHLWKASGVEIGEVLQRLVALALERHQAKQKITYTFDSSVLKQAGAMKLGKKL